MHGKVSMWVVSIFEECSNRFCWISLKRCLKREALQNKLWIQGHTTYLNREKRKGIEEKISDCEVAYEWFLWSKHVTVSKYPHNLWFILYTEQKLELNAFRQCIRYCYMAKLYMHPHDSSAIGELYLEWIYSNSSNILQLCFYLDDEGAAFKVANSENQCTVVTSLIWHISNYFDIRLKRPIMERRNHEPRAQNPTRDRCLHACLLAPFCCIHLLIHWETSL